MKLITKAISLALIKAHPRSTEDKLPADIPVIVKLFNPTGVGTWYITEAEWNKDTQNWVMFGLCVIHEAELGYVSLAELERFKAPVFGLGIERDIHYKGTLLDAMQNEGYSHLDPCG